MDGPPLLSDNPKGEHAERWRHAAGCGRFFNALRDTASDRMLATYRIGEPRGRGGRRVGLRGAGGEIAGRARLFFVTYFVACWRLACKLPGPPGFPGAGKTISPNGAGR